LAWFGHSHLVQEELRSPLERAAPLRPRSSSSISPSSSMRNQTDGAAPPDGCRSGTDVDLKTSIDKMIAWASKSTPAPEHTVEDSKQSIAKTAPPSTPASELSNGKPSLAAREQLRREKNREAVKRCRKRKNDRLRELELLTTKLQAQNSQLKKEVKKARVSNGLIDSPFLPSSCSESEIYEAIQSTMSEALRSISSACDLLKMLGGSSPDDIRDHAAMVNKMLIKACADNPTTRNFLRTALCQQQSDECNTQQSNAE